MHVGTCNPVPRSADVNNFFTEPMGLCKFKDVFGKPGTGVHSIRFAGVAIVDVLLTMLLAYVVSTIFRISFCKTVMALLIVGVISHRLFCVRTTMDRVLFG